MVQPIPAPSLRELLSAAKLRECTSLNGKRNRFLSFRRGDENRPYPQISASTRLNGTSSRNFPAPSLREPGTPSSGPGTIHRTARKLGRCGRFSSPLRNSKDFGFYHSTGDTPSVSLSLDSSLREGAGMGRVPFNVPPGNHDVSGDFHRPYETQLPCHQSNVSRVVVYSWQVTPDLSPVMGRGLAARAFSRRSAAWGRQMWRRSMASAFRMLWGLA